MKVCILCGSSDDDELNLGEFLSLEDVDVHCHYFCLLFTPLLTTRGEDHEGIRGFLLEDIRKESKRVKLLRCWFCKKSRANLGCCNDQCPKAFHLGCGLKNGATLEFCGHYETFCRKHSSTKQEGKPRATDTCRICQEKMKKSSRVIRVPCCRGSWFHHECLQRAALIAGVFAKCPLCNNKEEFRSSLQRMGVFFPEKDADWELDRTIFDEYSHSPPKLCEKCGNSTDLDYSTAPWLWKICSVCGASAVHVSCSDEKENEDFTCNGCQTILSKPKAPVTPQLNSLEKKTKESTAKNHQKAPTSPSLELSTKKSLNKIEKAKSPKKPPKKFTPWFSDDEQLDESDSDDFYKAPKRLCADWSPKRLRAD